MNPERAPGPLAARLHAALPQTQCQRCGYADCAAYAQAMAEEGAPINQCPPGGEAGIARLAAITGRSATALNPEHGQEAPRQLALIDETWCIGCTLCIQACPTDAIVGANKYMHTVMAEHCTGCGLCVPVCPVDCIDLPNASGAATGWMAWSSVQADAALARYRQRQERQAREQAQQQAAAAAQAQTPVKQAMLAAALARAKQRRGATGSA